MADSFPTPVICRSKVTPARRFSLHPIENRIADQSRIAQTGQRLTEWEFLLGRAGSGTSMERLTTAFAGGESASGKIRTALIKKTFCCRFFAAVPSPF